MVTYPQKVDKTVLVRYKHERPLRKTIFQVVQKGIKPQLTDGVTFSAAQTIQCATYSFTLWCSSEAYL